MLCDALGGSDLVSLAASQGIIGLFSAVENVINPES